MTHERNDYHDKKRPKASESNTAHRSVPREINTTQTQDNATVTITVMNQQMLIQGTSCISIMGDRNEQ